MERVLQLETCTVDLDRRLAVRQRGNELLSEPEAAILEYLAARPGRAVSRDEILREVWPFDAGPQGTHAVDVAMRTLRMKVERNPSNPAHLLTTRHVGYRFEPTPTPVGAPETPGMPPRREIRPGALRLPGEPRSFSGREADLEVLQDVLSSRPAMVSVIGPPGVGKSRLVLRLAYLFRGPDTEVAFVSLRPRMAGWDVVQRIGEALQLPLDPAATVERRTEQLARALADRGPTLLILDDFDGIRDAARLLPALAEAAPNLGIAVTSERGLKLGAEVVLALESLEEREAVALLLARARTQVAGWGSGEAATLARIAMDVDGLPLAIEIVAGHAPMLAPSTLHSLLRAAIRTAPETDRDPREEVIRQVIAWSWDLLGDAEQDALAQLSVFEASFTAADADAVVDLGAHPTAPWVLEWLQLLVDKGLLRAGWPLGRFELPGIVREVARERLDGASGARERHRAWALGAGLRHLPDLQTHRRRSAVAELKQLAADLRGVGEGAGDDPAAAVGAARVLCALYEITGPIEARRDAVALGLVAATEPADRATFLLAHAEVLQALSDGEGSMAAAEQAAELARAAGRGALVARSVAQQAYLLQERASYSPARKRAVQALELAREADDRATEVGVLLRLGQLASQQGDAKGAEERYREMLVAAEALGSWRQQARARSNLGALARAADRFDEARDQFRATLELAREAGDLVLEASLLANLGALASARGELDRALLLFGQALERFRATGTRRYEATTLANYGILLLGVGRLREARNRLVEARELCTDRDGPRLAGMIEGNLGVCHSLLGQLDRARECLERATENLGIRGTPFSHAYFSAQLAIVCADLDDMPAAEAASGNASPDLGTHPTVKGLRTVMRAHFELARGRIKLRDGLDPGPHQRRFEAALEEAEAISARSREVELANSLDAILPSELDAAIRNLKRTAGDRPLVRVA